MASAETQQTKEGESVSAKTSHFMASLSSDHISSTHHAKKVLGGAATVEYEDDFEKANASLQVAWTWDKTCDDLHTDEEVQPSMGGVRMKLTSTGI